MFCDWGIGHVEITIPDKQFTHKPRNCHTLISVTHTPPPPQKEKKKRKNCWEQTYLQCTTLVCINSFMMYSVFY